MRNENKRPQGGLLRSFSSYLRIVSNGASSVASTVKSVGSSIANSVADSDSARGQVYWSGFDKLECENDALRQVLLLGYSSGFQVWDVENANDVRQLVSKHDGPVSFLQMLKKPISTENSLDNFSDVRPLLIIAGDASLSSNTNNFEGNVGSQDVDNENSLPTFVHLFSLKTHEYIRVLKFRTPVYSVRCSHRIVAVSQATQIHCFDAGTFEKTYTILTCPIVSRDIGSGGIGYGPLAVGPRWLAYSGRPVIVSNTSRIAPQHLSSDTSLSQLASSGSLVAHYAKESSKQIAAGIVTLGDIGYKKLSRYYSEYVTDGNGSMKNSSSNFKSNGTINGHMPDMDIAGMVIVRDIVLRSVVVQFRAHRSPITALCFDPSGTLLVTASINGHNINIFQIMPSHTNSSDFNATGSSVHLYRLQRGITNAVIQDISFSDDSKWVMISSSRGTSHLYSVSDAMFGSNATTINESQSTMPAKIDSHNLTPLDNSVTLSATSRIRNGNGWKNTVTGAAAAATGRVSPLTGAIASVFHNCKGSGLYPDFNSFRTKYYLLVFSPTGSVIQYVLKQLTMEDSESYLSGINPVSNGLLQESDSRLVVEPLQKWDICNKRNRRDQGDFGDVYSDYENEESSKLFPKGARKGTNMYPTDSGLDAKVNDCNKTDENHHMYISEVELRTHTAQAPLWAKREIYFQVMIVETIRKGDYIMSGEIEIEKFPTQTVEARAKVIDYIRFPWLNQFRNGAQGNQRFGISDGSLTYHKYESSKDVKFSSSGSYSSHHASESSVNNYKENFPKLFSSIEAKDSSVNNIDDSRDMETIPEHGNNRERLQIEAGLDSVNSMEFLNSLSNVRANTETKNVPVNSSNDSKNVETLPEHVYNREGLQIEACLESVDCLEALNIVNSFPDVHAYRETENELVNGNKDSKNVETEPNTVNNGGFGVGGPA